MNFSLNQYSLAAGKTGFQASIFYAIGLIAAVTFVAFLTGALTALGAGFYAVLAVLLLTASSVILSNWRIGLWLSVLMLPFAATYLMPRQMLGIVGLNPMNAIVAATLGSLLLYALFSRKAIQLPRIPRIFVFYLALIFLAALHGSFYATLTAPTQTDAAGNLIAMSKTRYLLDVLVKPMFIILVALLAAIVAREGRGRSLILALALSATLFFSIVVGYLILTGASLQVLASSRARGFLSWMGMHANELGLMSNMILAVLLFAALACRQWGLRVVLFVAAIAAGMTALLTFSRGAFLGMAMIAAYYLLSRRKLGQLFLGLVTLAIIALVLPEAFIERATTGLANKNVGAITAGRYDDIWRPLWPWVWDSPVWGHGLSSTLWAPPNRLGTMLPVGHPHSAYLGVLLDFGLLGAAIIGVFFWSMWRLFRKLKSNHSDPLWRGVFEGGCVCLLLLLVQGLADDRFVPTYPQVALWLAYGLALGQGIAEAETRKN